MTLGIYGDSFADGRHGSVSSQTSWTKELLETSAIGTCYAASGTSTWWSYEEFLSTYENHNTIIFCYSYPGRWPVLPNELIGSNWNTRDSYTHHSDERMKLYKQVYHDIFSTNFFEFIEYNIFKSVNEICKNKGKYLINLMPLKFKYNSDITNFPIFHNLDKVSLREKIIRNGKIYYLARLHSKENINDKRYCHLNNLNNKLLAGLLQDTIKNKKTEITIDLFKETDWQEFDPMMQSVYQFDLW